MENASDHLNLPPFPRLTWSPYGWWEGAIGLEFGRDAGLTVTLPEPDVSRIPSQAQREALAYQFDHGPDVIRSVLAALLLYYDRVRPAFVEFLGPAAKELMPDVTAPDDLRILIDLRQVHVHPWEKDGVGYIGLQFECTWDQEHGLGLMLHQKRVVDIGGADTSFAWAPDEADESN